MQSTVLGAESTPMALRTELDEEVEMLAKRAETLAKKYIDAGDYARAAKLLAMLESTRENSPTSASADPMSSESGLHTPPNHATSLGTGGPTTSKQSPPVSTATISSLAEARARRTK